MEVTLAVLADYANATVDGKLNIMGVFDVVRTPTLPTRIRQMGLVFTVKGHNAERDQLHDIQIIIQDPDGRTIARLQGAFIFSEDLPGEPLSSHQVVDLRDLPLFTPDIHLFSIFVNNSLLRQVKLSVVLAGGHESNLVDAVE